VNVGNYLKMAERQRIWALLELGWSYRRIEKETGIRRETIARYDPRRPPNPANPTAGSGEGVEAQGDGEEENRPNPTAGSGRVGSDPGPPSACEPFRAEIEKGVEKGLTAQRIWQDLVEEHGFAHGYESVKRFVRRLRRRHPEVADVLEHPPGQEAQVDYFDGPPTLDPTTGRWRRPSIFRMTLCCSRHGYEEPIWGQDRASFLRAHEHAFLTFGGVPRVVRHDNLKAAVVRACLYDPDVSELYTAFARHWGFVPLPTRPRHPQENGIEERSGGYVKSNALKGRRFGGGLEELAVFLKHWNRTIAQLRIHGTTRQQVIAHFLAVEKPALQPLPTERFSLFEVGTRTVHNDGHVEVAAAFYSVPHPLVGREVRVHWDEHLVRVYHEGAAVAVHTRLPAGSWSTRPEHRPPHKPAQQSAYEAGLLARIERIGPQAAAWACEAIVEREVRAYRLLQGVVSLTRTHPRERVDWACGVALERRCFRYRVLRRLVDEAAERAAPAKLLVQRHPVIRDLAEYAPLVAPRTTPDEPADRLPLRRPRTPAPTPS
jgi:transposase